MPLMFFVCVCVFGMTTWEWMDNQGAQLWKRLNLHVSADFNCLQLSTQGCGFLWFPPLTLEPVLPSFKCCLGNHKVQVSWVQLICYIQETWYHRRHPGPLALMLFHSAFHDVPRALGVGCIVDISTRAVHPTVGCSLFFTSCGLLQ